MAQEQPIPLQTDTITQAGAGAGVRTVLAQVVINGQPQLVQMQVCVLADANGNLIDSLVQSGNDALLAELRNIRLLLTTIAANAGADLPDINP